MSSPRNRSVDIARGIAMIAIVLGHLGNANINRVVFTFHLPIFFLITGYYLNTGDNVLTVVKKRFRTLIVPYFLACAGVTVSACVMNLIKLRMTGSGESTGSVISQWVYASLYGAGDSYTEPFYIKGIGAIWFLWAMFWAIFFLCLIRKAKPSLRIILVAGLFAAGYFSKLLCWFPLSMQAGACATFYLYVGSLVRDFKADYERASSEVKTALFVVCLAAWVNFMVQFQSFWLVHCDIGRGPLDVVGSLCACYVLMVLCGVIAKGPTFVSSSLAFLGQYSLFMLVAHIIELDTFPWHMLTEKAAQYGGGATSQLLVLILCKFIWIIFFTILCAKTNRIRKLLGMKQNFNKTTTDKH